ncbi:hypothetical protein DFS33DRAFT_746865 [Desarmillaria ectypa]|nr:hypothetical protein DFS33DRAFT_746865 [Desarmillaria ectypa]
MVAYEPPAAASAAHKAFAEYINAFDTFDAERLLATFDDNDFTFTLLPKAMAVPSMNKAQFKSYFSTSMLPAFNGMSLKVHEVIEAGESTIVAHAQSDSVSKLGTEWHNEYIFIFKFAASKGGELPKITSYTEYVNSAMVAGFIAEETKKRASL